MVAVATTTGPRDGGNSSSASFAGRPAVGRTVPLVVRLVLGLRAGWIDCERVANRGHEVGEALAGAGARLNEQMVARHHRVLDGTRHRQLAVARLATDPGDREGEQFLDAGNLRCGHGSKGSWHTRCDGGVHPQPHMSRWNIQTWTALGWRSGHGRRFGSMSLRSGLDRHGGW